MGLYVLVLVILYLIVFTRLKSAADKRRGLRQGRTAAADKTPTAAADYSGSVSDAVRVPFKDKDQEGWHTLTGKPHEFPLRGRRTKFDRAGDSVRHDDCTHVRYSEKFRDFEDRQHDWLARQIEEERRALRRLNF